MNKVSAYTGYAVATTVQYVQSNFYKLSFLVLAVVATAHVVTLTEYVNLIGARFYQFTEWFHDTMEATGTHS